MLSFESSVPSSLSFLPATSDVYDYVVCVPCTDGAMINYGLRKVPDSSHALGFQLETILDEVWSPASKDSGDGLWHKSACIDEMCTLANSKIGGETFIEMLHSAKTNSY